MNEQEFVIVNADGKVLFSANTGHSCVRLSRKVIPGTPMRRVFGELVPVS